MSLTSGLFGWLVSILTVASFVGLVLIWPKLAERGVRRVSGRVGLLLGVNLLVLLTAAVQLNNQFLFFADWADLGGALGGASTQSGLHRGGSAQSAAEQPVAGPAAPTAATLQPLPVGTSLQDDVMSYQVTGPISGVTAQIVVATPPGYASAAAAGSTYPVLETFSGYPGSNTQWVKTMRIQSNLAAQVAAHKIHPVLVVSPQVEVPAGVDTECVDGGGSNPKVETWLTRDVPDWVAAHFRVRAQRDAWATIGLSAGGWCAGMAAMLHPAQYGGAVVLGGYFRPDFGAVYDPLRGVTSGRYDLVSLARRSPPALALWVETSHADPVSYSSSTELLKVARPPLSVSATVLQNAGHRIGVWQGLVPNVLTWLGTTLPGFRP